MTQTIINEHKSHKEPTALWSTLENRYAPKTAVSRRDGPGRSRAGQSRSRAGQGSNLLIPEPGPSFNHVICARPSARPGPRKLWPGPPDLDYAWPEARFRPGKDRKSTRLNSSHLGISYAVF